MSKKLIYLVSFVLLVAQASNAAEVARWDFEETSGTIATDKIGSYVATLQGSASLGVDGKFGSGLDFVGDGGAVVDDAGTAAVQFTGDHTIVVWVNPHTALTDFRRFVEFSSTSGGMEDGYRLMTLNGANSDNFRYGAYVGGRNWITHTRDIALNTWNLLVVRHDFGGEITLNVLQDGDSVDAAFVASNSQTRGAPGTITYADTNVHLGESTTGHHWDGQMDGVAFSDEVLTDAQVADIFNVAPPSEPIAASPNPAHEATDVPRDDVVLSWTPGPFADKHDVYFGNSFEDVNAATTANGEYQGNQTETTYALDRLDFGQTYYWRIDEVNAPPDNTVFTGDVWSFTVEPIAYPIADVNATASSSNAINEGPENTVNGSGLDDGDLHSMLGTDMWLSSIEPLGAWIQYEFDKVYKLHEMWVWNSNQMVELLIGFGLKDVMIEYSADGTEWMELGGVPEFAQGTGAAGYAHNTTIDFGGAAAKYIKIIAKSNWGGMLPQYGLSEVRFFHIPVHAREPNPDSDTTDVPIGTIDEPIDVTLSWRAGRDTAQHEVYLSTDEQAVTDGTAAITTVTEASQGPLSLDIGQTYYWRVDEVNDAETPTTWQGDVWNFRTHEYFVVDDFEDYNDYPPDEIFSTWVDGYGVATNGSTAGYPEPDFLAGEHYIETTIVHGGAQSMPFFYDNNFKYSEATMTLSSQRDWTIRGVGVLSLWFYGDASNAAERMYVALNSSAVVYHGNPDAALIDEWTEWTIDLQEFAAQGVNLANVNTIAIGFGDKNNLQAGGSGLVFFDDIRLYRPVPEPEPAP